MNIRKKTIQPARSIPSHPGASSSSPDDTPEADLWQEFKRGSEEAFVVIYRRYFQKLYAYGHQLTGDTALIEDCIQELFIELRVKRERLKDTASIKFYLFKALRNRIMRKLSRKKNLPLDEPLMDGHNFWISFSHEHKMIHAQLDREMKQALSEVMNRLTIKQREVVLYYYYEKLSYAEIADLMNLSKPKFARDLLYRAIGKLKVEMKNRHLDFLALLLGLVPW